MEMGEKSKSKDSFLHAPHIYSGDEKGKSDPMYPFPFIPLSRTGQNEWTLPPICESTY